MKKEIILGLGIFLSLIISFTLISALGTQYICLNKGERIYFSDCNSGARDYICTENKCALCVNEIRTDVYCPGGDPSVCNLGECTYLYDEPEPPVIEPPVEDPTNVVLISPVNNHILSAPTQVTFSFKTIKKTQAARFANCDLVIDGDVVSSKSGPQFNLQYNLKVAVANGVHAWRIYCKEATADGGDVIMSEQRTITIGTTPGTECGNGLIETGEECDDGNTANSDGCSSICKIEQEQQTEISLVNPVVGYSATDTQIIDFKFDIASSILSKITSCSLILNNANAQTITSLVATDNTIPYSVTPASYTWRVDCVDNLNQITSSIERTFTINSPAAPPASGGSSGGGGGGGGGGSSTPTYTLTQDQLVNGSTQSLAKLARFKFKILTEDHYVTVDEISTTYVQVTVASEPQKFLLYIGDEKKVDVNNDNVYDISVVLNKIESSKANITIKGISEPMSEEEIEANQETTDNTESTSTQTPANLLSGITGAVIGTVKNNKIPVAIGFIIIVAIAGVFSYNYQMKKKKK